MFKRVLSKPMIIVFVGTVGGGKSTQMGLLAKHLRSNGHKVKVTRLKIGHLWAHPLYELALKGRSIFRNGFLFKLWMISDMLAISLKFLISIWLPFKVGRIVLVEECLPSVIADYLYIARINGHQPKDIRAIVAHTCKLATLAPFISVFIDANDTVLMKRWRLRGTSREKPEYIFMQRRLLISLSKLLFDSFIYIDTSNSTVEETNHRLKEYLQKLDSSRGCVHKC